MQTLAIIGSQGGLATALHKKFSEEYIVECFGKEQYNLTDVNDIDKLSEKISKFDVIINCAGVLNQDSWNTFIINAVAPARLIEQLTKHNSNAHLVLVGSHSSTWTSWPEISLERLWYNVSKETLESLVLGTNHSRGTKLKFTVFNPSRFQTPMRNFSGYSADIMVSAIEHIITTVPPPLIYELGSPDDI